MHLSTITSAMKEEHGVTQNNQQVLLIQREQRRGIYQEGNMGRCEGDGAGINRARRKREMNIPGRENGKCKCPKESGKKINGKK